jgi:CheY-like chemotaxis protein
MYKIVIIEDSSFMRARIVSLLHGNDFTDTEDFVIADDIGRKPHLYLDDVDLIIADIQLPGISGIDLAHTLKKDVRYAHIPIMFVSGHGDPKTISAAIRAGAADYVVKPFDNAIFLEKVKKILGEPYEIPEGFEYDEVKFIQTISMEYQRSSRGLSPLSFLKFRTDNSDIQKSIGVAKKHIRCIDTICVYRNNLILILPLTDDKGTKVVADKLKMQFCDNDLRLLSADAFFYPGGREISADEFTDALLQFAK